MRKTTLSRSLLLTAALTLGGSLGAQAQEQQQVLYYDEAAPVTSTEQLTDGDYVLDLYNTSSGNTATGLINYDPNRGENDRYAALYNFDFTNGIITDESYIWTLTWNEDKSAFTLQNKEYTNIYFSTNNKNLGNLQHGDMQTGGADAAGLYEPQLIATEQTGDGKARFFLRLTNPKNNVEDMYLHTNNQGSYKRLSYWEGQPDASTSSSAVQMAFHPVTKRTRPTTRPTAGDKILNGTQIVNGGQYVIKNVGDAAARQGWLFEQSTEESTYQIRVDVPHKNYTPAGLLDANYIFTAEAVEGEANTFRFRAASGNYLTSGTSGQVTTSAEGTNVTVLPKTSGVTDGTLNLQVPGSYLNVDAPSAEGDGNGFTVAYNISSDPNGKWEIYPVNAANGYVDVTYSYTSSLGTAFSVTTSRKEVIGTPFVAADNYPSTYTSSCEEGTFSNETQDVTVTLTPRNNLRFALNAAITGDEFAPGTQWLTLSIRNGKAVIKDGDRTKTDGTTRTLKAENLWCITEAADAPGAVKLYNLAAGATMPLSLDNGTAGNSNAVFAEGEGATFDVVNSTAQNDNSRIILVVHGTTNAVLDDMNSNHLALWSPGVIQDDGNRLLPQSIDDLTGAIGYVGGMPDCAEANAYATNPTAANLRTLCDIYTGPVEFNPDKVYSIYNARAEESLSSESVNTDGTTMTGNVLTSEHDATSDYAALWQFETAGDNTYKLRNLNAGAYYLAGSVATLTDADAASILAIGEGNAVNNWTLSVTNNSSLGENIYLNAQHCDDANQGNPNSHEIGTWRNGANDAGNRWMLKEVNAVTVNVSDALWATLNLPFAVEIPTGVKAYTGGETSTDAVALNEVTGVIPAHTPVVLNADEARAYTFPIAYDAVTTKPVVGNTFLGTGLRRTGFAAGSFYALANPASGVGFYTATDNVTAVPANKAYMNRTTGSEAAGYRFIIGEDPTVGIDHAIEPATGATKTYYDLQGRRVLYPSHGIYVTQDGKKVFIK